MITQLLEQPELVSEWSTWFQALNLGVTGLGVYLFVAGRIVASKFLEKERARAEAAEKREQVLHDLLIEKVIPTLTRAADALQDISANRRSGP